MGLCTDKFIASHTYKSEIINKIYKKALINKIYKSSEDVDFCSEMNKKVGICFIIIFLSVIKSWKFLLNCSGKIKS